MESAKIVSICVSGFAGTSEALKSIAEVSGCARHFILTQKGVDGPETQFLVGYLKQIKPKTIILGGWSEHYEGFTRNIRSKTIDFAVYWTSSAGQTEISGEMDKFSQILYNPRIKYILFADKSLAGSLGDSLAQQSKCVYYLPPCFPMHKLQELSICAARNRQGDDRERKVISFFCSPHELRRKNALNVMLALAGLDEDYILYLNGLARNKHYRRLLQQLGITYRDFGWMERKKYERILSEVHLGLQVSFADSFNQVLADHIIQGVPVIASEMTPVLKNVDPSLRSRVIVTNSDNCLEIRRKIKYLLRHPQVCSRIVESTQCQLVIDNAESIKTVETVLRKLS